MWNRLIQKRRAVVVVDGFFEWLRKSDKHKEPHFIRYKNASKPFCMAALYDVWLSPAAAKTSADTVKKEESPAWRVKYPPGTELYTFAVVTCDMAPELAWLHDRMPCIFESMDEINLWLDTSRPFSEVAHLLRPYRSQEHQEPLLIYPVPMMVSSVKSEGPECVMPREQYDSKHGIKAFFSKAERGAAAISPTPMKSAGEQKTKTTEMNNQTTTTTTTTAINSSEPLVKRTEPITIDLDADEPTAAISGMKRAADNGLTKKQTPPTLATGQTNIRSFFAKEPSKEEAQNRYKKQKL
jgi:putative SOS response-associated peptidase YedK